MLKIETQMNHADLDNLPIEDDGVVLDINTNELC